MILNYLYDGRVDRLSIEEFYRFINYLDTLSSKQIAKARKLYQK